MLASKTGRFEPIWTVVGAVDVFPRRIGSEVAIWTSLKANWTPSCLKAPDMRDRERERLGRVEKKQACPVQDCRAHLGVQVAIAINLSS